MKKLANSFHIDTRLRGLLMVLLLVWLGGCTTATQHAESMSSAHLMGQQQGLAAEVHKLEKGMLTKPDEHGVRHIRLDTPVIKLLELGALYHYAGMYERSNEALEIVYAHYADEEMKTSINFSGLMKAGAKSIFSEALGTAYELAGYEKVFLHTLKTQNYLMMGDLEGAMVEVRRAEHQQSLIEDETRKDREKLRKEKQQNRNNLQNLQKKDIDNSQNSFMEQAGLSDEEKALIADMVDGYRNAVTYNLSSIGYELQRATEGNRVLDDATIDLGKSLALQYNPGVADRFVRWATYRGLRSAPQNQKLIKVVRKRDRKLYRNAVAAPNQMKNVHVFVHTGYSPRIEKLNIRIPNPRSKTLSKIAIPRYKRQPDQKYRLVITDGKHHGQAGRDLDFDALALKTFNDKLPGIYFRALLRLIVNTEVDREMNERMGWMGSVLAAVKNELMEDVDTRSWTSLPKIIHYGTLFTRQANIRVKVLDESGRAVFNQTYPMKTGKVLMVDIRLLGKKSVAQSAYVDAKTGVKVGRGGLHDEIRKLQARLNALGFDAGPADGVPGAKTRAALQAFQNTHGLSPTGKLDQEAMTAVQKAFKEMVLQVQTLLQQKGFDPGKPDGIAGNKTYKAVKAYQASAGLPVDGVIDMKLLNQLQNN